MDFKATSTRAGLRRRLLGMTLLEVLIGSSIGSIVLAAVTSTAYINARSSAALVNYVDLDNSSRSALDRMTQEIRQANRLISGTTNELVFEDYDGSELRYIYNPTSKELTRLRNDVRRTLLTNCDQLTFSLYQRNPVSGTYDQYPAATAATCKIIQMNWTCSRPLVGSLINTESVQSAKVVIRRQ